MYIPTTPEIRRFYGHKLAATVGGILVDGARSGARSGAGDEVKKGDRGPAERKVQRCKSERSSRGGKVTRVWLARGKGPKKITEYGVQITEER